MMAINDCNIWSTKKKDLLYHNCQVCRRKLKVSQIQFKRISKYLFFDILIFYCNTCDLYYIIFKFDNSTKKRVCINDKKLNNEQFNRDF